MIKLFAVDLDGCVTVPFKTPNWDVFTKVRDLNRESRHDETIPALTVCTGRPFPYAEAAAQYLDIYYPIVFEGGGGLYHPVTTSLTWSPKLTDEQLRTISELRQWVESEILPGYPGTMIEFTKRTDVGVVSADLAEIKEIYTRVRDRIMKHYDIFEVHNSDVSVNVVLKQCNKGAGLEQISNHTGIALEDMAFMGDGTNDLPALSRVRLPYAPSNARDEVKKIARVMPGEVTTAVLEAYNDIIALNRKG